MNPISGYFGKGRTTEMLKTSVVTRELALQKREINRCSILKLKALKYPTQSHSSGCMTTGNYQNPQNQP